MFMKFCKKWLGCLAALCPVVTWGQEFLVHPQNVTVCVEESAMFESKVATSQIEWKFNNVSYADLPSDITDDLMTENLVNTKENILVSKLIVKYDNNYNNSFVQLIASRLLVPTDSRSDIAHLLYKTNQQFSVTGLTLTITGTTAQFDWNKRDSNLTTEYFIGVYDSNHLIANQTTNTTYASFDLPPRASGTCQYLEFRFTANQCPDADSNGFVQNLYEATTFTYTNPDISPVTTQFDNNQTVLVSWSPDEVNAFRIIITDLDSGNDIQVTTEDDPPFNYTLKTCGQYNLKASVSPKQCADEPGFTHSDTISFTIPCPATETEPADQTSGALTNYPSLLLTVAAVIPLLKYFPTN